MRARWSGVLRWAALLGVVVTLASCSDLPLLAPKEPVTIRFTAPGSEDFYQPLIDAFEREHKNVTIELVQGRFYGFEQLADVDVLLAQQGAMGDLIDRGYPMSLNALISEDKDFALNDFYPGAVEALSIQGQRWAIPYMADAAVMVYNRDLFDKHNVLYPTAGWTWQDFLDRGLALTDAAAGEYGFAYQTSGDMGFIEPMLLIYQHGGQLFDDTNNPTRMVLNDPLTVEALQWYADLIYRHAISPPPGNRQIPFPQAGIEGGKYAMWLGFLSDDWGDLNVGVAPVPRDLNAVTLGSVLGLYIRADTQDPQACWEWIKFITNEAPPFLMPARRSVAEAAGALNADFVDAGRTSLEMMMTMNMNLDPQSDLWKQWGTITQAFMGAVSAIQNGDPVGESLDAAQRKMGY